MRNTLPILFLLLSFVSFSCKNDEKDPIPVRLTNILVTNSIYPDYSYSCIFNYNDDRLLKEYRESGSVAISSQSTHFYDDDKRLVALDLLNQGNDSNMKQTLIYNATGKLSAGTIIFPNASSSGVARPPIYFTFFYDGKGRVSRINSTNDPNTSGAAFIFEYDESGNIIREQFHMTTSTGELYQPYSTLVISYDDKKNPFYKLGSPFIKYGYSLQSISSFTSSFSPNNPIKVEIYDERGALTNILPFSYQYNKEEFPSEIKIGNTTLQLEY